MPIACGLTPPPPCLHVPYANYNLVDISVDGGTTWSAATFVTNDAWDIFPTVGGIGWKVLTLCGGVVANQQALLIQQVSNPSNQSEYNTYAYSGTYPATWTFSTLAGHPTGWPGGLVKVRTRCNGAFRGQLQNFLAQPTAFSTAAIGGQIVGDSIFLLIEQAGTTQGGSIVVPVLPTGWILLHGSSDHSSLLYWFPNAPSGKTAGVSSIGSPDILIWTMWAAITVPSTSILASTFLDAQPAATSLSVGPISFTGDAASMQGYFRQFRSQATSFTAASFSGPTGGFTLGTIVRATDGLAPPFNAMTSGPVFRSNLAAGSSSAGLTSDRSYGWFGGLVAIR